MTSAAALLEHPLSGFFALRAKAVADWITILADDYAGAPEDPHAGHGGEDPIEEHENPIIADAISGASARIASGAGTTRELRAAGSLGAIFTGTAGSRPVTVSAEFRGGHEPDYLTMAGYLTGQATLSKGNAVLSAFAGAGRDEVSPPSDPPGQAGKWPAHQQKVSGGFSLARILTPHLVLSGGASAALQSGRLSSPYRNALVGITYFPENLPDSRLRSVAFLQGSCYLGMGTALHVRQGAYADDWGVTAWIPETALAKEIGNDLLLTVRHRFYAQTRADFYRDVYADRRGFLTGDARLGRLYDQTLGVEAEYRLRGGNGGSGPILVTADYAFSRLEYPDLHPRTLISHVFSMGVRSEY